MTTDVIDTPGTVDPASAHPRVAGRLPGRSPRVLAVAAVLALLALVGIEAGWRAHGIPRSATDNIDLWSRSRRQVGTGRPDEVVVIGASRMQLLDLAAFAEGSGWAMPIQVSKGGINPIPLLADLAEVQDFVGVLLVGVPPTFFFDANPGRAGKARNLLDGWHEQMPVARFEHALRLALQMRLSMLNKGVAVQELLEPLFDGRLPEVPPGAVRPDRSRFIDFHLGDLERSRQVNVNVFTRTSRQPTMEHVQWRVRSVAGHVRRITARGGAVVFVRMPSSGPVLQAERAEWPRWEYWNRLEKWVDDAVFVHFADHPELSGYDCPDYSHLNSPDAEPFSRDLGALLRAELGPRRPGGP